MWDSLHDSGILKIRVAEIDFDLYEKNTQKSMKLIKNIVKAVKKIH